MSPSFLLPHSHTQLTHSLRITTVINVACRTQHHESSLLIVKMLHVTVGKTYRTDATKPRSLSKAKEMFLSWAWR